MKEEKKTKDKNSVVGRKEIKSDSRQGGAHRSKLLEKIFFTFVRGLSFLSSPSRKNNSWYVLILLLSTL